MFHSWNKRGTYEVKVKAKDINDAESGWSDALEVVIPLYHQPLLQWLFGWMKEFLSSLMAG